MFGETLGRRASVLLCALVAFVTLFASGWAAPAQAATFPCSIGPSDISGLSFTNAGDGSFQLGGVLTAANITATSGGCNNLPSATAIRPLVGGTATGTLNQPVTNATSQGGSLMRTAAGEVQYRPPSPSFSGTDTFTIDNNNTSRVINVTVVVAPATLPPTVSSLSPAQGRTSGGTAVIITGSNFSGSTAVTFGATPATSFTVNSSTQIVATSPAQAAGVVDVVVTNPDGSSSTSAASQYTYVAPPAVTAIAPTSGPASGGTTVVLTGVNFANATAVTFGGAAATSVTVNSATQVTATAPAGTGTVDIRITTPGGTSATSAADQYTYVAAPTVTGVAPNSGSTAGGTAVTITGTGLSGATSVTFGGNAASNVVIAGDGQSLTATTPAGSAGAATVSVTTPGGTGQLAGGYTYVVLTAPSVTTQPQNQTAAAGATATFSIAGSGSPSPTVQWQVSTNGGASYSNISGASGTSYTTPATTPSDNGALYRAILSNSQGTATSSAATLTVVSQPTANSQSLTFSYQTATALTLTGSDPNTPARTLSYTIGTAPAHGTLSGTAPNLTYTPAAGYSGSDNFTFTVNNGVSTSAPATVTMTVTPAAPTVVTQPSSQSVTAGTTATFTASASGSPTVKWQDSSDGGGSWADIAGATSTTYTTPATTTADSGKRFRAVFTNAGGTATSNAATLTVVAPTITVAPTTLPNATVGAAYSQTVTAGGGVAPYSYALTAGALPSGMTFSSAGVLSGTPTAGGSFAFTVSATDSSTGGSAPFSGSRSYVLTVAAATISVTPATLPNGVAGRAYTQTVTASGGTGPYSFAVTAGALPPGWTLSSAGVLSGTATSSDMFNFTITATDSSTGAGAPYSGSRAYSVAVTSPFFTLTGPTLSAVVGQSYSGAFVAGGGTAPYTYFRAAGTLPTGLALASDGTLSGTPTSAGTFNFTVIARDSTGGPAAPYQVGSGYSFTVSAPAMVLSPSSLPGGQAGATYSQTLNASGGVAPYSYGITAGALPTGLVLDSSTGAISGTPTAQGTFNFTATATDSATGAGPTSASRAYSIVIAAPTIIIAPTSLPSGATGAAYSQTVTASGGTAPYIYAVTAGALPAGLSLSSSGALAGTPTASGSFNFTVTATDATTGSSAPYTGVQAYTLVIAAPTVTVDTATLPAATVASAYSQTLTASGGVGPYSYAVTSGALPAGVSLSSAGVLSGSPTQGGGFTFTVTATDSSGGAGPFSGSRALTLTVNGPSIAITPTSLPNANVGTAYSQVVTASGGVGPYSYAVTAGALPAGLTLASNGALSGAPSAGGVFNFTISATDSSGGSGPYSGAQTYSLTVSAPTMTLSPTSLPNATAGAAYSATVSASGGVSPYSYAVTSGALPAGISLASNGALSGTPTAGGSFNFTITATDSSTGTGAPFTASRGYALTVAAATIVVTPTTLPGGQVEAAYSQSLSASGGTAPYAYAVTAGAVPAGLNLSSAGVLSGAPTTSGTFNFTVTATDASAGSGPFSGSQAYALVIAAPNPPVAGDLAATVAYGSTNNAISPVLSGGTADSVAVSTGPAHGAVAVSGRSFLYTPAAGYFGTDSFTYTATNGGGVSAPATVSITVGAPPAPVTTSVSGVAVPYASPGFAIDLSASISSVYDRIDVATAPAHGTVSVSGAVATYRPASNYFGDDTFSFTASGPGGTSSASTVSLTVATPPPPDVTPPAPVVVPPASGGGAAPTSVDLGARTRGVTDGYRVTTSARFGASVISTTPATTPQGSDTFALVYTPADNFIGTDTVNVVAFGPGGDSAPATFTFQVAGKAPDLSGSVVSSGTLTVSPTETLVGGPFQALRITRQPAFGTATVQGLNIVFTPGVANGGSTSLDYVIDLPFGSSAAGRLDLTVGQVPASQTLTADTIQGRPVTVRISDTAGGPFTGAAVTSISPTTAGSAAIAGTTGTYDLTFTPQDAFSGQAVIRFTLTNASGTSTGTLTVTVAARPDPSLDPDVRGVASGQITAARRFSDAQVDNFQRRLEGLRDGSNESGNGLSLNFGSGANQDDRDPRVALRRQLGQDQRLDPGALGDDRDRDMLGLEFASDRTVTVDPTKSQANSLNAAPAGQGAAEGGGSVGVWTSGSVDWGRQDAQGLRDSRFTTQGVTAGLDVRVNEQLIVGGGLGYGEDKTRIGDNGSMSRGKATTGALYASWRPANDWFVDGVIGLTDLDFDSRRWVVGLLGQAGGYADGERSGDVRFASAAFGRTLRRQGLAADLYVRMEGRDIALDGFTETSGGLSALAWDAIDQSGLSVNLGASWRWVIESRRFGVLRPTVRLEWSHELEDIEIQGVRYADWAASPTYLIPLDGWSRDALNLDLGAEWSLSDRLMLSLGYRGMLGDASSSHGGQIGLKYGW